MKKINLLNIPEQLRQCPRWVVWRREKRHRKFTKVPYNARTGKKASSTDRATWSTFAEATAAYATGRYSGIGFVLSDDDGIFGIDLDKCRNRETGALEPWAQDEVNGMKTYTEGSPSGDGVHMFGIGKLPPGGRRKGRIEVYESARYLTVTGDHIPGTPLTVEDCSDRVADFHESNFGAAVAPRTVGTRLDDEAVLAKAKAAKNGAKFVRLWGGDWSDYPSQSEAELALCAMLAYWCGGDTAQMDRLFRQSGLYRPKWDEPHFSGGRTYGQATVEKAAQGCIAPAAEVERGLPDIVVTGRPLQDMTNETLAALEAANQPPEIFVRSAGICRVRADENKRPLIEQVTESQLRHRMARSAYYLKETRNGWQHTPPPMDIVKDVGANGHWRFPALVGIVEVPVIRPDGTVLDVAGYDAQTKLIYYPTPGLRVPKIAEAPSKDDVDWALSTVDELIADFQFGNGSSRTHAVGALLTPLIRPLISGPTPMGLIDAPMKGTGKGLLADCFSIVPTGRSAALMTAPDTEDEWRKRITAALLEGATVITIDNLEGKLESSSLAAALTSVTWKDRILGRSETATLPQRATWFATGNNIRLGGDMPRRCYLIRLDAKVARPWLRSGWRHADLSHWASEHRGELIAALLTLVRHWYADGCPDYVSPRLGSFESWSRVTGNVLSHAGLRGFLANCDDLYQNNDADGGQWEAFFEAWASAFDDRPVTVADVMRELCTNPRLREAIPDWLADDYTRDPGKFRKHLGEALARQRDAQYGPWRLERCGENRRKVALWRVAWVATEARVA
jgi:hypothetical protein